MRGWTGGPGSLPPLRAPDVEIGCFDGGGVAGREVLGVAPRAALASSLAEDRDTVPRASRGTVPPWWQPSSASRLPDGRRVEVVRIRPPPRGGSPMC
ncbi:hypothetical protein [Streptomyces sp. SID8014]|uniref:hypothetical protein n=1 Tax=Streptomyces sp. SID8014 TaxID=2706097 RepID=UPI001EF20DB3|nr:hypothetical protein [Streptomyces sp. SID8014]